MMLSVKVEFHIHVDWGSKSYTKGTVKSNDSNHDEVMILDQAKKEIIRLEATKSHSTIENYRTAFRSFAQYLDRDIPSDELSAELIGGYERWLHNRNVCPNTISCYMRSLRSIVGNICGDAALKYFKTVFTGRSKTDKRAIKQQDLIRLRNIPLKKGSFLSLARDLFLFSFYALGMPFVDMAFLRKEHIHDNQIIYHRHKTGQRICVPLEPCMKRIIRRYQRRGCDYIFPIVHSEAPSVAYKEYLTKLNNYNRTLKVLATMAGIGCNLTSYVSRHTWASTAYSNNVELPVISKGLGHVNPQNTLIYIKEINDSRLFEANHRLIRLIE